MKTPRILASAFLLGGALSTFAQAPASSRGSALPPEVEAAIKAQAEALKTQPATGMPAPRNTMPPPLASGKAGEDMVVGVMTISESRSISANGPGNAQMNLQLMVTGNTGAGSMLRQVTVAKSTDDAGQAIPAAPARGGLVSTSMLSNLSRLAAMFRNNPGGPAMLSSSVTMGAPPRGARSIGSLEGEVEIYTPSEKDGSMVTLKNLKARAGKPLDDEILARNGIEFVLLTPETLPEYQARSGRGGIVVLGGAPNATAGPQFYVRDPGGKLVGFVALDATGMPFNISGGGGAGPDAGAIYTLMSPGRGGAAPTDDPSVAIFVATPGSLKSYPFRMENIPLP